MEPTTTMVRAQLPLPAHGPVNGSGRELREGNVVAGKYRLQHMLGRGATAVVMAAVHVELGDRVAIKFLVVPHEGYRSLLEARFIDEARAVVRIHSEHVVRIRDFGRLANGTLYQVLELLEGADLEQVLYERKGPLAVDEAVGFVLQACEGLAEAHALGIVHRDLKPANLFLTRRPDGSPLVKVLDFGISKAPSAPPAMAAAAAASGPAELLGSLGYMPPEQVEGPDTVDARADVWALGATLYELLTGSLVYAGGSLDAWLAQIAGDPPIPARARRPEIPELLDRVVLKCLEKDPAERFRDAAALARALLPFASAGSPDESITWNRNEAPKPGELGPSAMVRPASLGI